MKNNPLFCGVRSLYFHRLCRSFWRMHGERPTWGGYRRLRAVAHRFALEGVRV